MSSTEHEFHLERERASSDKPAARYDKQGDMSDEERVEQAMTNFSKDFGRTAATYLESCIHCGVCAEVCQYYVQTGDPQYTPIWKLEPFKQAYKRESSPF